MNNSIRFVVSSAGKLVCHDDTIFTADFPSTFTNVSRPGTVLMCLPNFHADGMQMALANGIRRAAKTFHDVYFWLNAKSTAAWRKANRAANSREALRNE